MSVVKQVEIKVGERYWITFATEPELAKVLGVYEQQGAKLVRYRIGYPIIGRTKVETIQKFWDRLVKE